MVVDDEIAAAPNRRERRVRETRRAILDAARQMFESDGYAQTTVEHIASRADVAPRTFFRYFPNKESLLFADFDEVRREMLEALEARPEDEDPLQSLSIALAELAAVIERRRDELVWGFRMCAENNVVGVYERSVIKQHSHDRIAEFIAQRLGVEAEADPRPLAWATAVMGVFGVSMRAVASGEREPDVDPVARFDELLRSTADALRACADVRA